MPSHDHAHDHTQVPPHDHDHEKSHFDEAAATWDDDPEKLTLAAGVAAAIGEAVPLAPDWDVLEFGAGTGLLSQALLDRVGTIDLVDTSAGMVEQARRRFDGNDDVRVARIDLAAEPAPRGSYDLIVAQLSLHHVPDLAGMLARFATLLAPSGWIAIAELAEDPGGDFHAHLAGFDGHHGFDPAQFEQLLRAAGFTATGHVGCGEITRGGDGEQRTFGVNLITGSLG